ncbi:MAG TPA: transketolase [Cyanobacteria bacterium UBA9971]|nr:transketolase [Cyanobacteria bacterium UBA9971]
MITDNRKISSLRVAYGEALAELGKENQDIVVLDCDLSKSTQTIIFKNACPERFFNMGIAEQDAVSTAAGFASAGKIPFISTFAIFASGRAWEQVRNSIAYPKFNVKVVGTHGGLTVGEDGASHQALEDICLMRVMPNMTVIAPADSIEVKAAVKFATEYKGPVYLRIPRPNLPELHDEAEYKFDMKAHILREGKDLTIASYGETVIECLKCAEILEQKGISAEVINVSTIKPLDEKTILQSAQKTGVVMTVENHSIIGGLGGAVCELLSETLPIPVKRIGVRDQFGQSGKDTELMAKYGLTAEKFIDEAIKLVEFKNK